jgi:hypothetical protein
MILRNARGDHAMMLVLYISAVALLSLAETLQQIAPPSTKKERPRWQESQSGSTRPRVSPAGRAEEAANEELFERRATHA